MARTFPTPKQKVASLPIFLSHVLIKSLSRLRRNFKADWMPSFLLPNRCSINGVATWCNIFHSYGHRVVAAKFAVNGEPVKTPFTLEDIERDHEGATQDSVQKYLKDLHDLGVISYTTHVSDGHSEYFDIKGNKLSSAAVHESYEIADEANRNAVRQAFVAHSLRETDYFTFSRQLAAAGVYTWVMDPVKMPCTFCSKLGEQLLVDPI